MSYSQSLTVDTVTTENHASEVERQIAEQLHAAILQAMQAGAEVARQEAPVKTGALRDSITVEDNGIEGGVSLGAGVEYAIFQELGTRHIAPHPFVAPGMQEARRVLQQLTGGQ
jgi:HK97 gp10 family phage protein